MNIYEEMLELFGENGENWTKNSLEKEGKYCLVGAAGKVCGIFLPESNSYIMASEIRYEIPGGLNILAHIIQEQYPDFAYNYDIVASFNDEHEWKDVRTVLEKAKVRENEI